MGRKYYLDPETGDKIYIRDKAPNMSNYRKAVEQDEIDAKKTEKTRIDFDGEQFTLNGEVLNYQRLHDIHLEQPDFAFIVYGDRAYLLSYVQDNPEQMREMRWESSIATNTAVKTGGIYVVSNDGVEIAGVSVRDINSENQGNKVSELTETNKNSAVNYPSNAAVSAEISRLNKYIEETQGRISGVSKVSDFLYDYICPTLDYSYAADYFKSENADVAGFSCSSARSGNFFGRNFDWLYDNNVEFVVKTEASNEKHATIGIAGQLSKLNKEFVETGYYDDAYKILPFMVTDGINDCGVVCSMNVVPMDYGETTGTISESSNPVEICSLMLPRYVLDNFGSALDAVNYIRDSMTVYVPKKLHDMHYETHIMIADVQNTYAVEFINNQIKVIDITNSPYMTNFHLFGATFNADGSVYTPETMDAAHNAMITNGITQYGSGLERYNIIAANIGTSGSSDGMRSLMDMLTYTNTYKRSTTPFWYTEYVGGQNTVASNLSDFASVVDEYIGYYDGRQRGDGKTWQTAHSAVYDIKNKTVVVREQEGNADHIYSFGYYTKDEVDSELNVLKENLPHKLTEPANMAVGKYFRIAAIDDKGHAVLEAVDAPNGGITSLKAAEAGMGTGYDIDIVNGVATIPAGTGGKAGLMRAMTAYGLATYGDGQLGLSRTTPTDCNKRIQNDIKPLSLGYLDYYVKAAMSAPIADTAGQIGGVFHYPAWTADEQLAGRQRLGIVTLTQEEYDLLESPSESTIYIIVEAAT